MSADPFGWIGQVIDGRYRIDRVVGSGGFGVVYRAQHIALGGPVAVKCLDLRRLVDPVRQQSFLRAFLDEGRILHNLASKTPAVVRVLDLSAATSPWNFWSPYLVLEWLEGETLAEYLARRVAEGRTIDLREATRLLAPIASALETAHAIGIAHRDVKPANIFVVEDVTPTLKVLDFGIAKVMSDQLGPSYDTTGQSLQAFSAAYGAPEQFEPGAAGLGATGPWTDVYSLALILIEMVSGRRAYDGTNAAHFHAQATNRTVRPSLAARGVHAPPALEQLLQRALAVDPRNRPTSVGPFWREVEAIAKTATTSTIAPLPARVPAGPTPEMLPVRSAPSQLVESSTTAPRVHVPPPPRTNPRSRRSGSTIAGVGVLALAVFGVAYALSRTPEPEPVPAAPAEDPAPTSNKPTKPKPVVPKGPARVEPTKLVVVHGGTGTFGTKSVGNTYDEALTNADVTDFALEKYEVSIGQYKQCVDDGVCSAPKALDTTEPSASCDLNTANQSLPVACVNYEQAKQYCESIGRRLPTAREWEFAARGVAGAEGPWGSSPIGCESAVYGRASKSMDPNSTECAFKGIGPLEVTSPRLGVTPTGIYGLAGNIAEWTSTEFPEFNKPGEATRRGVHGGAWTSPPNRLPGYRRWIWPGNSASSITGIRCAAAAP